MNRPMLAAPDIVSGAAPADAWRLLTGRFFMSSAQAVSSIALPLALIHSGYGASGIGTVLAVMVLVGLIEMVLVGAYADRGHLRIFLVFFPFTSVICIVPFVMQASPIWLAVAAVIAGYGGGQGATSGGTGPYQPAEYAWIGRNYSNQLRNRLVSVFSATSVAGVVLGSIVAIEAVPLAQLFGFGTSGSAQARALIVMVGVLALVPTTIGFFVSEPAHLPGPAAPLVSLRGRARALRNLVIPEQSHTLLRKLSIVGGMNGVAVGCFGQFVNVWLILHFHVHAATIGYINLAIAAASVAGDLCCARFAGRLGLIRSVIITRGIQSILVIVVALSPNLAFAEVFLLIRQVAQRLNLPLRDSYSIAQAGSQEKGRVSAITSISNQGTMAMSSEASGVLIERFGYVMPFCVSGVIQLASAVLFHLYFARQPPPEESAREIDTGPAPNLALPAPVGVK